MASALAIGHKVRLLEKIVEHDDAADLSVPCPHPGCTVVLSVYPEEAKYPLVMAPASGHGHDFTRAHRECVEVLVSEYHGWFKQHQAEPLPF